MSFGLMFIAVNLVYLLFSVTIGVIVLIILEKKSKWTLTKRLSISTGIFLFVLILPFYDLLIQKAIKTYYETFKRNDTVYSYPEKDKNGKIESLNNTSSFSYVNGFLMFDESYKTFLHSFNNVSDFVEIKLLLTRDTNGKYIGKYGEKFIRYDLQDKKYSYINISEKDFKARYIVDATSLEPKLFNLYQEKKFIFKDRKQEKVLATAWRIEFPKNRESFRSKFLLWRSANGVPIGLDFISNDKAISEKVLGFDYRINVSKLRG